MLSCNDDMGAGASSEKNLRLSHYSTTNRQAANYNFSYNTNGFLTSYEEIDRSEAYNIVYDASNKITQFEQPIYGQVNYEYNNKGQIVNINYPDNSPYMGVNADYTYNENGLISKCDFEYTFDLGDPLHRPAVRTYEYDSQNRLTTLTILRESDNLEDFRGNEDVRYTLSYDNAGNVTEIRMEWTMGMDTNGNEEFYDAGTITFTYDDKINPSYHMIAAMGTDSNLNLYPFPIGTVNTEGSISDFGPNTIDDFLAGIYIYNPNNVTNVNFDEGYRQINYEYEYNDANLPVSAVETITDGGEVEDTFNHVWEYENINN